MKIATVLTVLTAIVLVHAAPFVPSIPFGGSESITSSFPSNNHVLEKRTPDVGNTGLSAPEYDIQSLSNNNYNLRKRRDPSPTSRNVKRGGYNPWDPQSGYEGYESSGDIKKRRDSSGTRGSTSKIIKRYGGYDPKSPQGGNGGDDDGGYGDGFNKRSSSRSSSSSLRRRDGEMDPVDPFEAAVAHGDADLKKREEAVMGLES